MRSVCRYFLLPLVPVLCIPLARAQSTFDVNIGFGAAQDKAATTGLDQYTFQSCALGSSATCSATPKLNSFMLGFGARAMLWKRFGVGGEVNLQPAQQTYALLQPADLSVGQPAVNLNSRVVFYDFNGIFAPLTTKRAAVQFEGGIGGVNMRFYEKSVGTNSLIGGFNSSQYAASSNHFQVHAGAGVQLYLAGNFFVRPQFDIHYVPNFNQFGRNLVTEETVWVGYSFGER